MDKSSIKSFAVNSRIKLKEQIEQKAYNVGITKNEIKKPEVYEDTFEVNGNKFPKRTLKHRESLVSKINELGFDQVIEKVAYIWFNRLIAIRFMEVNEYLPSGVRVLSSTDSNKSEPDIIREAANLDFENLNLDLIYRLQDENNIEGLFKYLLIKQCNELGRIMPEVFEEIEDFTELLLPDNLLQEGSIVRDLVTSIAEDDWKEQVEIIGWLYQYYISEKKDEVFEGLKKNIKITKENIPAATQLFTPDWIVKYMVENSLGRLWLEGHPNEELKSKWKYYLEEAEQEPEVQKQLDEIREKNKHLKPEDIKFLDPCMGSGHILVYAFEVLYDIYKSAGYFERDIPKLILEKNLYGLDIDDRAAQLAYFAVMMKARSYNRRIFREKIDLNICSIQESNGFPKEAIDFLVNPKETEIEKRVHRDDVEYLINVFNDAKEYGSILEVKEIDFDKIEGRVEEIKNGYTSDIFEWQYKNVILEKIPALIKQAKAISQKYDIVSTNPPYMGLKGMSEKLKNHLEKKFKKSKLDMFAVFIERAWSYTKRYGYVSMITRESWMFLTSYEKLRQNVIGNKSIVNLVYMPYDGKGRTSIGMSFGTVAFVMLNTKIENLIGTYNCIRYFEIDENGSPFKFPVKNDRHKCVSIEDLKSIPGVPIAYWINKSMMDKYKQYKKIQDYSDYSGAQNKTANNEKYIRKIWEISQADLDSRWIKIAKGGFFRKWFGNIEDVIDWSEGAREYYRTNKTSCIMLDKYLFRQGITWTKVTSYNKPGFRYIDNKVLYETAAPTIHIEDNWKYFLGLLNSVIGEKFIKITKQTLNYQIFDIVNVPVCISDKYLSKVEELVSKCIAISEFGWNSYENSYGFKVHPIIHFMSDSSLEKSFDKWREFTLEQFSQLKELEEELNKIFIEIYDLEEELNVQVLDEDITLSLSNKEKDIRSFISYAIGCMLGRYSPDKEGLIYAGGEFEPQKYKTFEVDIDNVIPITDDEYFEDDIVTRFIDFVKITFSEETLEENLDYIADTLGKKANETSRQTIRRYFLKDFYKDHLQTYQKRPIYWLFDSGKNDGFKALIYMHRYDSGTVARIRTDYLHPLQRKYEAEINRLDMVLDLPNASTREKNEARKKKEKIQKQILECVQYDQVIAHVANQKIEIDLDDGVVVNYAKFQGVEVPQGEGKKPFKADLLAKI